MCAVLSRRMLHAGEPFAIRSDAMESVAVDVRGASDLDGDGVSEFFFAATWSANEGAPDDGSRPIRIATYRGGAVVPYAPLGSIHAASVEDYDADGRLDLRVRSEYTATSATCGGRNAAVYSGPTRLYHTLSDGTFSDTDSVARMAMLDACPAQPTRLIAPSTHETLRVDSTDHGMDTEETVMRIACARYWDQAPDDLARRITAEYPRSAATCLPLNTLVHLAQTPPASALRIR